MLSEYKFSLGRYLERRLKNRIKNQIDLIKLCLESSREILVSNDTKEVFRDKDEGFRIVYPNQSGERMQRAFFLNKRNDYNSQPMYTIHTFVYPFKINKETDGSFKILANFSNIDAFEINSQSISQIMSLVNIIDKEELTWGDTWVEELMDLLFGKGSYPATDQLFYIINELLLFDFGYLRFDNDPEHEGQNHPKYHIDNHINNKATFKLGLKNSMGISELINLLDNSTTVKYIDY